ncbi:MAG: flagellar hook-basal body complex protein FliE [Pseudomonadota bacterium]
MDIKQAASAYNKVANIAQDSIIDNKASKSHAIDNSFSDMVTNALDKSVEKGKKAENLSTLALMGKADINELATAVGSAELALNTVVAIRDKVISAYQQIMQMPI